MSNSNPAEINKSAIRNLLELGKQKGNLSNHEILDALAEVDFDPE